MTNEPSITQPDGANGTNGANASPSINGNGATSTARRNGNAGRRAEATLLPPVDVVEDKTGITLYADLPGVAKDKLDVRVEADSLLIEGELGLTMPDGMSPHHAEVQTSRYRRTFALSKELDPAKIEAEFEHGVLRVRIPKAENAQPRRVPVQVH